MRQIRHFGGFSEAQSQQIALGCVSSATMRSRNKWLHNVDGLRISRINCMTSE
jgi:hypothetical protein